MAENIVSTEELFSQPTTISTDELFGNKTVSTEELLRENTISTEELFKKPITIKTVAKNAWDKWKNLPGIKQGDVAVEEVSKFIEPDTAQPGVAGMLKFMPRQMAADALRAYKPSQLIPFTGAAKLVKPLVGPILKKTWELVPDNAKKVLLTNMTVGRGQPLAYQAAKKPLNLKVLLVQERLSP